MPAGSVPTGEVRDSLRDAAPPGVVDAEANASESDWPKAWLTKQRHPTRRIVITAARFGNIISPNRQACAR
jgi:hypothetical protein